VASLSDCVGLGLRGWVIGWISSDLAFGMGKRGIHVGLNEDIIITTLIGGV